MNEVINSQNLMGKFIRYRRIVLLIVLVCILSASFLYSLVASMPMIFKKDLYAHDESSNSVVAANITRKIFPPMVRVNPLNEEQGNWMEGPYWQHIPPIFAYVPYLGFLLDGKISIEVKRLSFAMLELLTALLFVTGIYWVTKRLFYSFTATLASFFWLNNFFTRDLVLGTKFGVSDIVLAFFVVLAFLGIAKYLSIERNNRITISLKSLIFIALLTTLPILAKNLLGLIPLILFCVLLVRDIGVKNRKFWISLITATGLLIVYYGLFFLSSPMTFLQEILTSINHFTNYEGWARPWHYYISYYLPADYLKDYTALFWIALFTGVLGLFMPLKRKNLLFLGFLYFIWNLATISVISSKTPNFLYQSLLLIFFFIITANFQILAKWVKFPQVGIKLSIVLLIISASTFIFSSFNFATAIYTNRVIPYAYDSEHEQFYLLAEHLEQKNVNLNDLVIFDYSPSDCWTRYYTLFLTGAESKTLLEMYFDLNKPDILKKYSNVYLIRSFDNRTKINSFSQSQISTFVIDQFVVNEKSLNAVKNYIDSRHNQHAQEIERIKKDKTSCQWLVPDLILNAH
jgi:hypothetical protein